jgi:hypothetical protein
MDGFKDTTRMKYMMGGDVKAYKTGGPVKKPVDQAKNPGLSKLPTDVRNKMGYMKKGGVMKKAEGGGAFNEKGKRATLAETEAEDRRMGSSMPAKKPMAKGIGVVPAMMAASKKATDTMKKGVPAYSDKPMVRRKTGGLMTMPKGKC